MQIVSDNGLAQWRVMLQRSQPASAVPVVERYARPESERLGARWSDDRPPHRGELVRTARGPAAIPPDMAQFVGRTLDISV